MFYIKQNTFIFIAALICCFIFLGAGKVAKKVNKEIMDNKSSYIIRRANQRGYFDHGWLQTYHTFSFGQYNDPRYMGFRTLRVINEDTVAPGKGFSAHSHDNMEIITIVLSGELAHKDSLGTEEIIHAGEIQAMSAGSGVTHSEYNPSTSNASHFLQIWIIPDTRNVQPRYQQRKLTHKENEWVLLVSPNGENNSLKIHQSAKVYILSLNASKSIEKTLDADHYGWIQIIEGDVAFNGESLHAGDGVALEKGTQITLHATTSSKILLFDLK